MAEIKLAMEHTGSSLETMLGFAFAVAGRYCEPGDVRIGDDERIMVVGARTPELLLKQVDSYGRNNFDGRITLPRFKNEQRYLIAELGAWPVGQIKVTTVSGDEAFLTEIQRTWSEFAGGEPGTLHHQFITTRDGKRVKPTRVLKESDP